MANTTIHNALAWGVLLASNSVCAQSADDASADDEIIMSAWTDPATCNRDTAIRLSMSKAIANRSDLNGKCVAVEGYWSRRALFERKDLAERRDAQSSQSLRHRRVGIYAKDEVLQAAPVKAQRHLMVGIYGRCETQWPKAIMVMGYCHYTDGPILLLSEAIEAAPSSVR